MLFTIARRAVLDQLKERYNRSDQLPPVEREVLILFYLRDLALVPVRP